MTLPGPAAKLRLQGHTFGPGHVAVMAIINRTADSFYPAGRQPGLDQALRAAEEAVADGADILDIGGVRAGRGPEVSQDEEIERICPVIARLHREFGGQVVLSADTWRSGVAEAACEAGIGLVNDTWAGYDPGLAAVAARHGAGLVCSHTGAMTPRTDPFRPAYPPGPPGREAEGVAGEVTRALRKAASRARADGVDEDAILLDPTLDFGKTTWHSLALLRETEAITALGYPVLLAASRKDFVGESLGLEVTERLEGSLAAAAIATWLGVAAVRTHDVRQTRRAVDMAAVIRGERSPQAVIRAMV